MVDLYGTALDRAKRLAGVTVAALAAALIVAAPATANHYTNTTELSATTNTGAAIAWSRATFPATTPEIVLGRDDVFADSLASGSMQTSRPLLLTNSQTLSADTNTEINRLQPSVVNIMGGAGAVSVAIENDLKSRGYTVRRFSGPTRLETAIDVARRNYPTATSAIVASAFAPPNSDPTRAFADSIAAGGWAAGSGLPVLLTETERLSTSTRNYLRGSLIRSVFVVGGAGAVSEAAVTEMRQIGITVTRVAGATRFDTAIRIAQQRGFADGAKAAEVILTEGQAADSWASGFAAAAYANAKDAPIVLSNNAMLPDPTKNYLAPPGGAAGTKLVCGPRVQSAPCDAATAAMGHTAVSGALPRLASVAIAASLTPGESELHFRFTEPVNATVVGERFRIYTFDDIGIAPVSVARDAGRPEVVVARFPSAAFAEATTAAVAYDAVRSAATGVQGMEGSAGIQGVTRTGGNSRGPNLVSISRTSGSEVAATQTGDWEILFTFDKPVAACGQADSYILVRETANDQNTAIQTFEGTSTPDRPSATTCEVDFDVAAGDEALDIDDIVRAYVEAGTVSSTGLNGIVFDGPPTGTAGQTVGPDLTGFTVTPSTSSAIFTFDREIALATPTTNNQNTGDTRNFKLYDSRGNVIEGTGASVGTGNLRQVTVTFDPATTDAGLLYGAILGAAVENGAVQSRADVGIPDPNNPSTGSLFNGAQEIGSPNLQYVAGKTTGPRLVSVKRTALPGSTGTRITFAFDIPVDETPNAAANAGGFLVYSETGERTVLVADACTVDAQDQKNVNCDVASNASSINAVRSAAFGGVARDAVRPDDQTDLTDDASPNPEGGMAIT